MATQTIQFEDALEVVEWLDNTTENSTTILLKTELTKLIFEVHLEDGVVYDVAIDIYDDPASERFSVYDRDASETIYTVGV